jgi:hypothetical protein
MQGSTKMNLGIEANLTEAWLSSLAGSDVGAELCARGLFVIAAAFRPD